MFNWICFWFSHVIRIIYDRWFFIFIVFQSNRQIQIIHELHMLILDCFSICEEFCLSSGFERCFLNIYFTLMGQAKWILLLVNVWALIRRRIKSCFDFECVWCFVVQSLRRKIIYLLEWCSLLHCLWRLRLFLNCIKLIWWTHICLSLWCLIIGYSSLCGAIR